LLAHGASARTSRGSRIPASGGLRRCKCSQYQKYCCALRLASLPESGRDRSLRFARRLPKVTKENDPLLPRRYALPCAARRSGRLAELALAAPRLKQTLAEIPRLGCAAQRGRREFKSGVVRCARFIFDTLTPTLSRRRGRENNNSPHMQERESSKERSG
jgi:hypothetical protein